MPTISYRPNRPKTNNTIQSNIAPAIFDNTVVKLIFVGISVFLLYNVLHSVDITIQKVNILKNARTEVESLRVTNLELATQLQSMQNPEYIEVEARDRLNFSGTNDVVFVIPDSLLDSAGERLSVILDEKVEENKSNMEVWLDLLVHGS